MKKYLIIAIIFLAYGCGTDQGPTKIYNYTISNKSGYSIEIIPYNRQGNKEIDKKIILLNNQSLNQIHRDNPPYFSFTMTQLLANKLNVLFLDKIEIVFNNSKNIIYNNDCDNTTGIPGNCSPRNIFLLKYSRDQIETYTITPEDYQNAIDCGGNCN